MFSATTTLAKQSLVNDTAKIATNSVSARYAGLVPRKPWVAFLLSAALPSAGQFYNRQNTKGIVVVTLDLGAGIVLVASSRSTSSSFGPNGAQVLSILIILGTEIYQLFDAPIAAAAVNNRYHLGIKKSAFNAIKLSPTLIAPGNSLVGNRPVLGLSLMLR